jgi:hypothetical protein
VRVPGRSTPDAPGPAIRGPWRNHGASLARQVRAYKSVRTRELLAHYSLLPWPQ